MSRPSRRRTGEQGEGLSADRLPVHRDHGVLFLEFPADELERGEDPQHLLDDRQPLERVASRFRSSPIAPMIVRSTPREMCAVSPFP